MERRWCPDCRNRQRVVETYTEAIYESGGTQHYAVTDLACGHQLQREGQWRRDAPGEPWTPGAYPTVKAAMKPSYSPFPE